MRFDVVCFGALNLDKIYSVNHIAKADEESVISFYMQSPGGSAANTAAGLARLGLKIGYIGKIAKDREGIFLKKEFDKEGVNTCGIITSKIGRTGTVMGFVDQKGNRALYLDPGVNDSLEYSEVNIEYISETRIVHMTSFASDKPYKAQIMLAKNNPNKTFTLDPGMIYARKGWSVLEPLIKRCFAVLPNEHELKLLTGEGYEKGAQFLLDEGVHVVAVKLGERGSYVTNGKENHLIEPFRVKVVDTTGAGDAFCAGFIYGLTKNKSLKECGLLGNFVASRCLSKMGARNGLPKIGELPFYNQERSENEDLN